jgi:hypothetical protein
MRCRHPLTPLAIIAVAAVSLLAAGCGGRSSTSAATTTQHQALAYSHCMHTHGVPNFPDPNSSGQIPKDQIIAQNPSNPQFKAAQRACARLWPYRNPAQNSAHGQTRTAAMLAFARCIRRHGFPNFPDPTSSGQLTPEMAAHAGINLHQPAVLRVADTCVSVTHGILTKAAVARALNQPNTAGQ